MNQLSDSRQAGAEIEITPEMVEAGLMALWPCELLAFQDAAEVLEQVFRAMMKTRDHSHIRYG